MSAASSYLNQPCRSEAQVVQDRREAEYDRGERVCGYLGKDGAFVDWEGKPLGTWRSVSSWPTPRSFVSTRMHQVEVTANGGKVYTGRCGGEGLIYFGRLKKGRK